jgi:lysine-N-methylase
MLGPGEEEGLRSLDWSGRDAELAGVETVVTSELPGGRRVRRLARRADGSCVYLGADQLCTIHRHFGGDHKPLLCRLYPFAFHPVGDRIAVDCSFACRSVSRGSGEPLAARWPEWTALLGGRGDAAQRHRLTRDRRIDGALLWELEHHLLGFLSEESLPLFDRVRCCLQMVRLATSGDPATATAAKLRAAIARGLPKQIAAIRRGGPMDRTQRAVFYQWLFLALNPPPPNFDLLDRGARRVEERRRLEAAERFVAQEGAPWVDDRPLAVTCEQAAAVDAGAVAGERAPLLARYLRAKVIGQRFLAAGEEELPLVEAVPLFLLVYPMAIWTSRALAADRGAAAVEEEDLRRALALLDRTLGQVPLAALPAKVARAWRFVVEDTDLVVAATNELLGWEDPPEDDELLPPALVV